jgi:hypothetical protein
MFIDRLKQKIKHRSIHVQLNLAETKETQPCTAQDRCAFYGGLFKSKTTV